MSDEAIHNPHDKLFKAGFGDPATAAAFLREELPAGVASLIDWSALRPEPGTFVDSHYRHSESDLLFSAPLAGKPCLVYLLFEHQIKEEAMLALRLLRYMVRIWEAHLKKHPESRALPVILPVVLAHNAVAWKLAPNFASIIDLPPGEGGAMAPFIPDFVFRLIQLADLPWERIRGNPEVVMILRVMKAERASQLLGDDVWDEALMARLSRALLDLLMRYILEAGIDKSAFERRVLSVATPEIRTIAMTIAQQIRQEGRQEGRQDDILEALELRFGTVPEGMAATLRGIHDDNRLRTLLRAAIRAASLEDFTKAL